MSIEVTKAIKARWDAKNLGDSITGGIHHSRTPEKTDQPYCVFNELSNPVTVKTHRSLYADFNVQFDVYVNDGDPESAADLANLIVGAMENSESALANPLSPASGEVLVADVTNEVTVTAEGDEQVYRAMFQMAFRWARARSITPA